MHTRTMSYVHAHTNKHTQARTHLHMHTNTQQKWSQLPFAAPPCLTLKRRQPHTLQCNLSSKSYCTAPHLHIPHTLWCARSMSCMRSHVCSRHKLLRTRLAVPNLASPAPHHPITQTHLHFKLTPSPMLHMHHTCPSPQHPLQRSHAMTTGAAQLHRQSLQWPVT